MKRLYKILVKLILVVLAQITFAQLSLFILNNCITVYR